MATEVIQPNEVILNLVRYPVIGKVRPVLTSTFPEKMVTGEYTKLSDINKDSWVILADQRGGILVEEMDEKKDANRCYWSTSNLNYKGHTFLPPLASTSTASTVTGDSTSTARPNAAGTNTNISIIFPDTGEVNYEDVDETSADDDTTYIYTYVTANYKDEVDTYNFADPSICGTIQHVKVYFRVKPDHITTNAERARAAIYTHATLHYGDWEDIMTSAWQTKSYTWTTNPDTGAAWTSAEIDALEIGVNLYAISENGSRGIKCTQVYAEILYTASAYRRSIFCDFNGKLYLARGTKLDVLNPSTGNFDNVFTAAAVITDLIAGVNDCLYAFCGDGTNYYYMDTAESETQADVSTAHFGVDWDSKLFKISSAGVLSYAATPNAASPSWTANGTIPFMTGEKVTRLYTYYNIDGDDVIYAETTNGQWVHDYANAKWLRTALKTPSHPTSGMGCIVWRDGLYVSAGLDVMKYVPDVPAQIISMGLDRDGGLPLKQDGEITWLAQGHNAMYALLDASRTSTTSYSSVMMYNGIGWQCVWTTTTASKPMHHALVSSALGYRLWFDHNDTIYSIPRQRSLLNPLKITTETYGTGSIHITPWFDADWQVGNKLALTHELYASGDVSVDETIIMKYRTNHTNTDRDTGWTTMDTVVASGLDTYTFGSSVGTAFKAIQFRYDLARKVADTDETPDILYAILYYKKVLPKKWGWRFTVDCSQPYHDRSAKQLLEALVTATELGTLMTFMYDTTTKYVEVRSVEGEQETGRTRKGQYTVFVTEL